MIIRPAASGDDDALWDILEPIIRSGETYALPRDWSRSQTLCFWHSPGHHVFIAEDGTSVVGTYFLSANHLGGGSHVANCGYATGQQFSGRGVASAMCVHSMELAASMGFTAMQFNFVVSSNARAVAAWKRHGFVIVGTLPTAFEHPILGFIDVYVMHRMLSSPDDSTSARLMTKKRSGLRADLFLGFLEIWWSCRGAAPRVRKAGLPLSPGSASNLS